MHETFLLGQNNSGNSAETVLSLAMTRASLGLSLKQSGTGVTNYRSFKSPLLLFTFFVSAGPVSIR